MATRGNTCWTSCCGNFYNDRCTASGFGSGAWESLWMLVVRFTSLRHERCRVVLSGWVGCGAVRGYAAMLQAGSSLMVQWIGPFRAMAIASRWSAAVVASLTNLTAWHVVVLTAQWMLSATWRPGFSSSQEPGSDGSESLGGHMMTWLSQAPNTRVGSCPAKLSMPRL